MLEFSGAIILWLYTLPFSLPSSPLLLLYARSSEVQELHFLYSSSAGIVNEP